MAERQVVRARVEIQGRWLDGQCVPLMSQLWFIRLPAREPAWTAAEAEAYFDGQVAKYNQKNYDLTAEAYGEFSYAAVSDRALMSSEECATQPWNQPACDGREVKKLHFESEEGSPDSWAEDDESVNRSEPADSPDRPSPSATPAAVPARARPKRWWWQLWK